MLLCTYAIERPTKTKGVPQKVYEGGMVPAEQKETYGVCEKKYSKSCCLYRTIQTKTKVYGLWFLRKALSFRARF